MSAVIDLPRRREAPGKPVPPGDLRESALAEFDRYLTQLRSVVHWLVAHGVKVQSSCVGRHGAVVTVEYAPLVDRLFGQEKAWRERQQVGTGSAVYTWFVVRFETRIEWDEVAA